MKAAKVHADKAHIGWQAQWVQRCPIGHGVGF